MAEQFLDQLWDKNPHLEEINLDHKGVKDLGHLMPKLLRFKKL